MPLLIQHLLNPARGYLCRLVGRQFNGHFGLTLNPHFRFCACALNHADRRAALWIGIDFPFGAIEQYRRRIDVTEEFRHTRHILRMRHARQTQRRTFGKRGRQFCQRMRAVTHAHSPAQRQLFRHWRAEMIDSDKGEFALIEFCLRRLCGGDGGNTQRGKYRFTGDARRVVADAMHQHREAQFYQQQRQQRREIALPTRSVVAGDHNRHRAVFRRLQLHHLRLHRLIKAAHFRFAFAFDTQRNQNAAKLQVRHLARQHRAIERHGSIKVDIAGMIFTATNLFNDFIQFHHSLPVKCAAQRRVGRRLRTVFFGTTVAGIAAGSGVSGCSIGKIGSAANSRLP